MAEQQYRVNLRMPDDMLDALALAADEERRPIADLIRYVLWLALVEHGFLAPVERTSVMRIKQPVSIGMPYDMVEALDQATSASQRPSASDLARAWLNDWLEDMGYLDEVREERGALRAL